MDSKGLFDALDNDLPQDDRKSALEVPIIEEFTTLLRTGMYTLKGEKSELVDRATLRQVGTVPRHKVSAVKSVTERVFFFVHMPSD